MQFISKKDSIPIQCRHHESNVIKYVCIQDRCQDRFFCEKCLVRENENQTQHQLEPLTNAWEVDLDKEMLVIQELQQEDNLLYQEKLQEIERAVDDIQKRMVNELQKAKMELIKSMPLINVVSNENWSEIYSQFTKLAQQYKKEPKQEAAIKYIAEYIDFKRRLNKIKRQRTIQRSQLTFNTEQLDKALKNISYEINQFKNYYFYPVERQWEINDVNLKNLKVDKYIEGPGDSLPRSIEFLPNRHLVVIGDKQGHLSLWDSIKFVRYQKIRAHVGYINNLKYYQRRDWLISASSDGLINIWQPEPGRKLKILQHIKASHKYIWGILVVDKKNIMYSCGGEPDVKIWSLNTFKMIDKINTSGKERMGRDIVLIEKYNVIAVGFQGGVIAFYDIDTKAEVNLISTQSKVIISCILYLPKDDLLIAGSDLNGKIGIWKLKDEYNSMYPEPELQGEIKVGGTYAEKMMPINQESELLVATGSTSKISTVNIKKRTSKALISTKLEDCVGFALNPAERRLVLGDYRSNQLAVLKY